MHAVNAGEANIHENFVQVFTVNNFISLISLLPQQGLPWTFVFHVWHAENSIEKKYWFNYFNY